MQTSRGNRVALLTGLALVAFAANSVLTRAALLRHSIDAASFASLRLVSGAIVLSALLAWRRGPPDAVTVPGDAGRSTHRSPTDAAAGSWISAAMLAAYAIPFSFAYLELSTATGALILFGFVQLTMIGGAIRAGERPLPRQWIGLSLAGGGLTYLLLPGLTAPPLGSASLMAGAGVGWGVYSLRGRGARSPIHSTRGNFARAVPFALVVSVFAASTFHAQMEGVLLALASGGLASGLGYAVWYAVLPDLSSTTAGVVQLSVPVLAAAAGVLLLSEDITFRLVASAVVVLGGIALATLETTRVTRGGPGMGTRRGPGIR